MLKYENLTGRRIMSMTNISAGPTISKMQAIALELDKIKKVLNKIEEKDNELVRIEELDVIEKRLDTLEFELFYDSLN